MGRTRPHGENGRGVGGTAQEGNSLGSVEGKVGRKGQGEGQDEMEGPGKKSMKRFLQSLPDIVGGPGKKHRAQGGDEAHQDGFDFYRRVVVPHLGVGL